MYLPKPVYEVLPCAYLAIGGICFYIVFGYPWLTGLTELEITAMFGAGCVLLAAGIVILCLRFRHRRNRTVFVKQA